MTGRDLLANFIAAYDEIVHDPEGITAGQVAGILGAYAPGYWSTVDGRAIAPHLGRLKHAGLVESKRRRDKPIAWRPSELGREVDAEVREALAEGFVPLNSIEIVRENGVGYILAGTL